MKKWIHAAEDPHQSIRDIEAQVYAKLDAYDIPESDIYSVNVIENSSRTFRIEVVIKSHRKKFKKTGYYSKVSQAVDAICYTVNAWLKEGNSVLLADTYVVLVQVNGLPVGFFSEKLYMRSGASFGIRFTTDPSKAKRYAKDTILSRQFIDTNEIYGPEFAVQTHSANYIKKLINGYKDDMFLYYYYPYNVSLSELKKDINDPNNPIIHIMYDPEREAKQPITLSLVSLEEARDIELYGFSDLKQFDLNNYIDLDTGEEK